MFWETLNDLLNLFSSRCEAALMKCDGDVGIAIQSLFTDAFNLRLVVDKQGHKLSIRTKVKVAIRRPCNLYVT